MSDNVHPMNPRPTYGGFTLHFGLLLDGVLYRDAVVRELSGEEEEILASASIPEHRKVAMVGERCLVSVGSARGSQDLFSSMTVMDRYMTLIALRRLSFGDRYPVTATCPKCQSKGKYDLDLGLVVTKKEPQDRAVRKWSGTLPAPGAGVVEYDAHVRDGADDEWYTAVIHSGHDQSELSLQLLSSMDSLDGVPLSRSGSDLEESLGRVRALTIRARMAFRRDVLAREGSLDTNADIRCLSCGNEWSARMAMDASFFFPPET